jgi:uncharacterized protein (TIGR02453 family)
MLSGTRVAMAGHFTPASFKFLRDLKRHNNREWFAAHRERYVADVEAPMLQFIADVGGRLRGISRAFVADPRRTGGSMFRIYRDTRFSPDKSPFKPWAAARFAHEARRKTDSVPSFYLHVGPDENYGGGGVYHIAMPALTRIRQHIVASPKSWAAVRRACGEIEGERLKRPPAGFDPAHKHIEDLKLKDLYVLAEFSESAVTSPNFLDRYLTSCERAAPLVEFLTKALGLRW